MNRERKNVFWFWGGMDLFYLLQFIGWNIYRRRVPIYDDILSFLPLLQTWGSAVPPGCLPFILF